jgi:hypothetical protein
MLISIMIIEEGPTGRTLHAHALINQSQRGHMMIFGGLMKETHRKTIANAMRQYIAKRVEMTFPLN